MKQLDIGCGGTKREREGYEYFGCDIVHPAWATECPHNFRQADLAIEPIPYAGDSFDLVTAYDFLEHLPSVLYLEKERISPLINIFNEVHRVLKDGGTFFFFVPVLPSEAVFQDPTHLNFWCTEKVNYFCGDYYGFHGHYGHTSRFEKVSVKVEVAHMTVELKAIKNLGKDGPYRLTY